jgi:hypothetical protein
MLDEKLQENILETRFLGTTAKIDAVKTGCIFSFHYRSATATDPHPIIIMTSGRWKSKDGKTYFNGVNLKGLGEEVANSIILEFGQKPVGSVSFNDIRKFAKEDPECCIRTYDVRKVQALHKVAVKSAKTEEE